MLNVRAQGDHGKFDGRHTNTARKREATASGSFSRPDHRQRAQQRVRSHPRSSAVARLPHTLTLGTLKFELRSYLGVKFKTRSVRILEFAAVAATCKPCPQMLRCLLASLVGVFSLSISRADSFFNAIECYKSARFLAPLDSPDYRKYAPDRDVQMNHLALDITPDFTNRTIGGEAQLTFSATAKPVSQVRLDSVDLDIDQITSSYKIESYEVGLKKITVNFTPPLAPSNAVTLRIKYHAEPKAGLYFRTPEMGYPAGDTHFFSQGEESDSRQWFPCLDAPNQRFTSEVTCHVPEGMTAISNGKLVSETKDDGTALVAIHWSQEKPQANYLVSLAAGNFKRIEDRYKDLPIAFYTPESEIAYASNSFRDTKDMLGFYEEEIGITYPWAKYDQVCVEDFPMGGMENTSCTTLTDNTLFTAATENIRTSEGLVAHELAHQWFGDLVTCKDWSQIWLNESFATFYQSLYNGHKNGHDAMLYEFFGRARQITGITNNYNAIVRRTYDSEHEMFDYLAYPKGSWVLRMLRAQLGDGLYRQCIKTYVQRHEYKNVVTEDLRRVVEELSGRNFDQFFDQWLYHGYHPELEIKYSWDGSAKLAKLSIKQTQKVSEQVLLFNFPVLIRLEGKFGRHEKNIEVKKKEEDFYFPLESAPDIVRFDPDYTLLAKVDFKLPKPMLYAQLANKEDVIGRLLAVEQLADSRDKETAEKLKAVLNDDPFWGARNEASRALRIMHSDAALDALLASTQQLDARVRRTVVADIGEFYNEKALASAQATANTERNPDIIAAALKGIGPYPNPEVEKTLLYFLNTNSFRNELSDSAIAAIRSADDPVFLRAVIQRVNSNGKNFTSRGLAQALETVAFLMQDRENKEGPRKFLLSYIYDPRERVRLGAIAALGILGDSGALPVLQRFAEATTESPERTAAEKAILALRENRKQSDDLKTLREEVLDLKKQSRETQTKLEQVSKKVEATKAAAAAGKSSRVTAPKHNP
jgi:aminopeptidase N